MAIDLQKNYDFAVREQKWQDFWQQQKLYKWHQESRKQDTFIVDTPPPTVSGQLHIGHVYSYTQTDFIVRFQRMIGKNIFYPMGFDDNGLPTERLVEKQKKIRAANLPRQEFIDICQQVIEVEEAKFRALFNKIALSVDWDLEYQTISPLSCKLSQMSFLDLITKGEIYRSEQPMLWDCVDQTALAQADIEDQTRVSALIDIALQTTDGQTLVIATTRPELLPACVAIFYHPEDERYKHLAGKFALSALFNVEVPILADDLVQKDKGTGLVMCSTFGDQLDVLWWKKHQLPTKIIIDKSGKIACDALAFTAGGASVAKQINGLKITDARDKIIEILQTAKLLHQRLEISQVVKCAERSGTPLEILITPQWFIRTLAHKGSLLKKTRELNWYPKTMKSRLENWINCLAWDWCISRQRYFGVPFPVWYSKRAGEEGKILLASKEQLPVDPSRDLPIGYQRDEVAPDIDVMDTWATSAISLQLSSHGIAKRFCHNLQRHLKLFPGDLRPQGHDILRTWAFYSILKGLLHANTLPWKSIMVSGWCLAEDRSKMSKSKGNIITPEQLLVKYGADVIRYWAATFKLGADTSYSEHVMQNGKRLVTKLLNAAKFASSHFQTLNSADQAATLMNVRHKICRTMDRWLISELGHLVGKVKTAMLKYEYALAMNLIEKFFMKNFCDNYLEITKIRAYNKDNSDTGGQYSVALTLYHSLQVIIKLFAPFLPYITEEIYQTIYQAGSSVHARSTWPSAGQLVSFAGTKPALVLIEILDLVKKSKTAGNLSIKAPIELIEIKHIKLSDELIRDLKNVTAAKQINFVKDFSATASAMANDKFSIYL